MLYQIMKNILAAALYLGSSMAKAEVLDAVPNEWEGEAQRFLNTHATTEPPSIFDYSSVTTDDPTENVFADENSLHDIYSWQWHRDLPNMDLSMQPVQEIQSNFSSENPKMNLDLYSPVFKPNSLLPASNPKAFNHVSLNDPSLETGSFTNQSDMEFGWSIPPELRRAPGKTRRRRGMDKPAPSGNND